MKYTFKDILSDCIYNDCRVMFITGQYNVFNNIVVDTLKDICKGSRSDNIDLELIKEFGISEAEQVEVSNSVNLETFISVVNMPNINGKWFASADLKTLTKKQQDWLKEYIKKPSENGILAIFSLEYKDYKFWLSNKIIQSCKEVNLIQLSFPNSESLKSIVRKMFEKRNASIDESALELFIVRMSKSYDDYDSIIERMCVNSLSDKQDNDNSGKLHTITYEKAFESLAGIENFVIEDFLRKITDQLNTDKVSGRNPIYRMLGYLIDEYGAKQLVNILKKKIDELIEFRLAINNGYIPIIVHYNIDEAKKLIGEENPIYNKSDYTFRELSKLASKTSLLDWTYMKMILENVRYKYDDTSYLRALYSLVSRSVLTESRINNDIGLDSIFDYSINFINNIKYKDS